METAAPTDKSVALPIVFLAVAVLAAAGMAAFGISGDQLAAAGSFATAMVAGTLAVAAYHVYA